MRFFKIVIFIYFMLLIQGCSIFGNKSENGVYIKSTNIKKSYSLKHWNKIGTSDSADLVYEKTNTGSLIIVNSNCRRNNLSSLQTLKASILAGIENLNIVDEKSSTLYERDALETNFNGSLDGVMRFMTLTIFQRDFCIYDMILIAKKQETHNRDLLDFEKLKLELFEF